MIQRGRRYLHRHRAGGQNDVFRIKGLLAAVMVGHLHLSGGVHPPGAGDALHLVGVEQAAHALGEFLHHLVLALEHGGHINARLADTDAVVGEVLARLQELVGTVQQGFGGDAAHIQAGAAV